MARATIPKILWGAGFTNTLSIGYPLDLALGYSTPREGSEWAQASSGVRDAWILGHDQRLRGLIRWIPTVDTVDPVATGWDGATGWRAFLEWARAMNAFRWYPDATSGAYHTCTLVEPLQGEPAQENDGSRQIQIVIEDTSQTDFSGY